MRRNLVQTCTPILYMLVPQEFCIIDLDLSGGHFFTPPGRHRPVPVKWMSTFWSELASIKTLEKLDLRVYNKWDRRAEGAQETCPDQQFFQAMSKLTQLR